MKYFLFTMLAFSVMSCSKIKRCYECTSVLKQQNYPTYTKKIVICDKTKNEIEEYQNNINNSPSTIDISVTCDIN